jgi:cellulose synthase (UDP-forming)
MKRVSSWAVRLAGIFLFGVTAWYVPWVLSNLNWGAPWLSIPFALATLLTALMTIVTVINHWHYAVPQERSVPAGEEPRVAVIIPTYGEPPSMLYQTARSVLQGDYPQERLVLFLSDDAHRLTTVELVYRLQYEFPRAEFVYHDPPRPGQPERRGEAKAGNLNSVLDRINAAYPDVQWIETRDADDMVGDPTFLRQALGQLLADPTAAFVQTIKEAQTGPGDPFGNLEPLFYRRAMLARNAANAVFPCGSGLVWRREALNDIGGFPTWNLVEDLQSGVEALRRGWRGVYLPIVGAVGQTAPEDIPNAIKQRGTWALDTLRLTFWGVKKGLSLRQNLQFSELGFFYLLSLAVLVFLTVPVVSLVFDLYPLVTSHQTYAAHFWPYAAAVELLLAALAQGLPYEALWRARQTWLGMAPVYARAALVALRYGPGRKPSYRVTRKFHQHQWYWRETLPQFLLLLGLIGASIYHLLTHSLLDRADLGSLFWAAFLAVALSRTVRNAWYGVSPRQVLAGWARGLSPRSPLRWALRSVAVMTRARDGMVGRGKGVG